MNLKGLYRYTENLNFEWRLRKTTLTMSCWLLSPSLDGSLLESFPEILFTCQMALGLTLAEGFICDKPDKRAHLLPRCLCWYQGSELRHKDSVGFSSSCLQLLRLSPSFRVPMQTTKEELVGMRDHLLVWPCYRRHPTRPLPVPVDGFLASRDASSLPTTLLGWQNTIKNKSFIGSAFCEEVQWFSLPSQLVSTRNMLHYRPSPTAIAKGSQLRPVPKFPSACH